MCPTLTEEVDLPLSLYTVAVTQVSATPVRHRRGSALIASYLVTLVFLVTVNFFLPRAMPGDPIDALFAQASPSYVYDDETRAGLADYYGLDRPLVVQYGDYLADLARGDLGVSISANRPVADLVGGRLPWTVLLVGTAVALGTLVGVVAGTQSGWRRGRTEDRGLLGVVLVVREFPAFLLGSLALLVLAVRVDWFPLAGGRDPFPESTSPLAQAVDIAHHLVLPATVLAVGLAAGQYLVMRAGMVSELGADYLVLGRAKGLRERRLEYRYAARNALLPVVSLTALQLGVAMTGAILVETVFAYPGLGLLVFDAVGARDYPLLQGCFLLTSAVVVTANAAADLLYRRLDPRVAT
ncbi:ABC transporter permease [soil metagenome]